MIHFNCAALLSIVWTLSSAAASSNLPLKLSVKIPLDSQTANVHVSNVGNVAYPFIVSYGGCESLNSQHETHHNISTIHKRESDRLVWILPEGIPADGCLSAWSAQYGLLGRSEPLKVDKYSGPWMRKRELNQRTRLSKREHTSRSNKKASVPKSKRQSIPMTNASGIDAQGPWFDGVEVLKNTEPGAVNVEEAKAKSNYSTGN